MASNNIINHPLLRPVASLFANIRRNHALEHATLAILRQKGAHGALGGISGVSGFWIIGEIDPTLLQSAVEEALNRLRAGEKRLAISPNCGSTYAIPGALAGLAAWLIMLLPGADSFKRKFDRLPLLMLAATLVYMLARPLAFRVQERVLTDPNPRTMKVSAILIYIRYGKYFQHVRTGQ